MKTVEAKFDELLIKTELPLMVTQINPNDNICKLALSGVYDEYNKGYKSIESNVKASFTSSWFSHKENYKFTPLVEFVESCCNVLIRSYFKKEFDVECFNCWGAIYREGDFTIEHNHFPSLLSACVYLDLEENSSHVFFDSTEVKVTKGSLLIFPGILKHKVEPTKGKRIVVAMNFKVKQPQ